MAAPLRVAVVGKGGAGKSVIAGTLARLLSRRGTPVLAIDSDQMAGLAFSVGAHPDAALAMHAAAERGADGGWRLKKGIGPVRFVRHYALPAPDGVRLLQVPKVTAGRPEEVQPALNAFYQALHRLRQARGVRDWSIVGDLPAGPRQAAFDWAPYADTFLLIVEPTWKSVLTARRIGRIARSRRGARALLVASKVRDSADASRIGELLGESPAAAIPADEAIAEAERLGRAPLDHAPDCVAVRAIESLASTLDA